MERIDGRKKPKAAPREGAARARTINRIMNEMELTRLPGARAEWRRELGDYLIAIQATDDGTWWLTVVCGKGDPSMEFSGNLGECIMQYSVSILSIMAGFGGQSRG